MTFRDLGLFEPIVRAVAQEGYEAPTPIQTQAIPSILAGRDVLGCAQTGTGKTGAFALPILQRLAGADGSHHQHAQRGKRSRTPRALVLSPTRELASQIYDSFKVYGRHVPLKHTAIFGGVNQFRQVRDLKAGVDVVVATPGRLLDLMQQGYVDLRAIEVLVLDEADRMLDMGFIHDIRRIVSALTGERQTLLFSATMPNEIRSLANSILRDPVHVQAAPVATPADAITQSVYMVRRSQKSALLERLLREDNVDRTLVFTRTKHGADKLVRTLHRAGIDAHAIHGNKSQGARTRALHGFKSGRLSVLVATDIASRGIDVDQITHVVNYDMPHEPETYVHRIGRTARAGASGVAVSFCDREELADLRAIERLIGMRLALGEGSNDLTFEAPAHHNGNGAARSANRSGNSHKRRRPRSNASAPAPVATERSHAKNRSFAYAGRGRRSKRAAAR